MTLRPRLLLAVIVVGSLLAAACGNRNTEGMPAPTPPTAPKSFRYDFQRFEIICNDGDKTCERETHNTENVVRFWVGRDADQQVLELRNEEDTSATLRQQESDTTAARIFWRTIPGPLKPFETYAINLTSTMVQQDLTRMPGPLMVLVDFGPASGLFQFQEERPARVAGGTHLDGGYRFQFDPARINELRADPKLLLNLPKKIFLQFRARWLDDHKDSTTSGKDAIFSYEYDLVLLPDEFPDAPVVAAPTPKLAATPTPTPRPTPAPTVRPAPTAPPSITLDKYVLKKVDITCGASDHTVTKSVSNCVDGGVFFYSSGDPKPSLDISAGSITYVRVGKAKPDPREPDTTRTISWTPPPQEMQLGQTYHVTMTASFAHPAGKVPYGALNAWLLPSASVAGEYVKVLSVKPDGYARIGNDADSTLIQNKDYAVVIDPEAARAFFQTEAQHQQLRADNISDYASRHALRLYVTAGGYTGDSGAGAKTSYGAPFSGAVAYAYEPVFKVGGP